MNHGKLDYIDMAEYYFSLISSSFHLLSVADVSKLDAEELHEFCTGLIQVVDYLKAETFKEVIRPELPTSGTEEVGYVKKRDDDTMVIKEEVYAGYEVH